MIRQETPIRPKMGFDLRPGFKKALISVSRSADKTKFFKTIGEGLAVDFKLAGGGSGQVPEAGGAGDLVASEIELNCPDMTVTKTNYCLESKFYLQNGA